MFDINQIVHCRTRKPLELEGSVAIVGNSDELLNSDFGEQIDAHDNVFRFNLASVENKYSKHIGTRSDFYLLSQNITTYRFPHPEPLQSRFREICRKSKIICYPDHTKNVMKYCKRPYLLMNDVNIINEVIKRALGTALVQFPANNHPRNGVKLAIALISSGIKPTLYGFDLSARENPIHYYDNEKQIDVGVGQAGHRLSLEYVLLQELAKKAYIEIKD